jgi:hypothetical protein
MGTEMDQFAGLDEEIIHRPATSATHHRMIHTPHMRQMPEKSKPTVAEERKSESSLITTYANAMPAIPSNSKPIAFRFMGGSLI